MDILLDQFRTTEFAVTLLVVKLVGGANVVETAELVVNGVDVTPFLIEETRK